MVVARAAWVDAGPAVKQELNDRYVEVIDYRRVVSRDRDQAETVVIAGVIRDDCRVVGRGENDSENPTLVCTMNPQPTPSR